jgi:hypothetical protein
MMRRTLSVGSVAAALLAGTGTAFAQAVVVEPPPAVYIVPAVPAAPPAAYYHEPYDNPPPPRRVYRYYRYYPYPGEDVVVVRPRVRVCGPNAYWDGESCVYARW